MLALFLTSTIAILATAKQPNQVEPQQATTRIWIQPSQIKCYSGDVYVGYRFNVTFWIETDQEVGGVQITTIFKHNIINVTQWWEPTWNSSYIFYGKTTSAPPFPPNPGYYQINATHSRSKIAVNLFPPPPAQTPFTGTGLIAILQFEIVSMPNETVTKLSSPLSINNDGTYLFLADGNPLREFTKEDGSYEIEFTTIPPMSLDVNPQKIEFTPYSSAIGQKFDISLSAVGVGTFHDLHKITFLFTYNSTLLSTNETNIHINAFWGTSSKSVTDGTINITISNPTSTPEGTILIANITFEITYQNEVPPGSLKDYSSSSLTFQNYHAYNSTGGEINIADPGACTVIVYPRFTGTVQIGISDPMPINVTTGQIIEGINYVDIAYIKKQGAYDADHYVINITTSEIYNVTEINIKLKYDPERTNYRYHAKFHGNLFTKYGIDYNITDDEKGNVSITILAKRVPIFSGTIIQLAFYVPEGSDCYDIVKSVGQCTTLINITEVSMKDGKGNVIPTSIQTPSTTILMTPEFPSSISILIMLTILTGTIIIAKTRNQRNRKKQ